jgi:hypothetical protein
MAVVVNTVLQEAVTIIAASDKKKASKVPKPLAQEEIDIIRLIVRYLQPFAIYTDQLQGDRVTSSTVILGLLTAMKGVKNPIYFCLYQS